MKKKISTIIITVVILILIIFLFDFFKTLFTVEGREAFKNIILDIGWSGYLIIIGLTIVQIFFVVLPGETVEILAGMCYGSIGGLIVLYIGILISSSIIFFLVRKIGKKSVYNFISKQKIDKIEKSKFFNSQNIERTLLILFVIPCSPKDLLLYIGAFIPNIKPVRFIILSTIMRFPSLITSTVAGASLVEGDIKFVIGVYAVTFILSFIVLYFLYNGKQNVKEIIDIEKNN